MNSREQKDDGGEFGVQGEDLPNLVTGGLPALEQGDRVKDADGQLNQFLEDTKAFGQKVEHIDGIGEEINAVADVVLKTKNGEFIQVCDPSHPAKNLELLDVTYIKTESELQAEVKEAAANGGKIRVVGSCLSFPETLLHNVCDAKLLSLAKGEDFLKIDVDPERKIVRCGAGVKIHSVGEHSCSPSTKYEDCLVYKLRQHKLALPCLSGISYQCIASYIATDSSGGSLTYQLSDSVVGLRILDGTGAFHDIYHPDYIPDGCNQDSDTFWAAGISMGLFGVLTEVTLQCVDEYTVVGEEVICPVDDCPYVDIFAEEDRGRVLNLRHWMEQTEYTSIKYCPQAASKVLGIRIAKEKVLLYHAERKPMPSEKEKKYENVPETIQLALAGVLDRLPKLDTTNGIGQFGKNLASFLFAVGTPNTRQEFWELWPALAIDNLIREDYWPVIFMELFFPIEKTYEVMTSVRKYMDTDNFYSHMGLLAWEFYGKKESKFWMSNSHGGDMLRVDVYFFWREKDPNPEEYFNEIMSFLKSENIDGYRFHWAKWHEKGTAAYTRCQFEKMDEWLALRKVYDPMDVFLTRYWQERILS